MARGHFLFHPFPSSFQKTVVRKSGVERIGDGRMDDEMNETGTQRKMQTQDTADSNIHKTLVDKESDNRNLRYRNNY